MQLNAIALSSLLIAAPVLSFAAPSANAQNFTPNTGGILGLCDSNSGYLHTRPLQVGGSSRDCEEARELAADEAARNRNHDRNSQLIGLGGNLITGLIFNSQQQRQAPKDDSAIKQAELALLKQQQEIELLKMQLQAQQAAQYSPYGVPVRVQNTYPVQPTYTHPAYTHPAPQPAAYSAAPAPYAY